MLGTALEDLHEEDILVLAGERAEAARQAEVDLLELATQWAILHDPERLDRQGSELPGRERSRRLGGEGAPQVCEFAAAELGARIGRSTYAAAQLMADGLDLRHRHPVLWGRVRAGEVRASYARHVVSQARSLSPEEAAYVDRAVAQSADGRIPWSRFEELVEAAVAAADPETAKAKEEQAARARFAKKCRDEANGMGTFMIRADIATIDQLDASVTARADQLTEAMPDSTDDERRVHAVLLMANPGKPDDAPLPDLLPTVLLHVHTYAGEGAGAVARLEGHGPVTMGWVRDVLGQRCRFRIQPVLDLAGQAPVDAYEIPDRHRQAVHLMTPADTFPFSSSLSRKKQVDHTIPYDEGGATGVGNYGPMTTLHHRIKTFGGWVVKQPFPGIYVWRDPHGAFYLVDHTGTRQLSSRVGTGPLVVEIYRNLPELRWDSA